MATKKITYHTTMIHGRFQPFHIGHLDYLIKALEVTENSLIVGITNPYPELILKEPSDDHRHLVQANPFSFFQRYSMIRESILKEASLEKYFTKISIIPFPIHHVDLWKYFIPMNTVQVMSVFEEWDIEKKKRFEQYGFKTHLLECQRLISGTLVRKKIANSNNSHEYEKLIPAGTRSILDQPQYYDFVEDIVANIFQ